MKILFIASYYPPDVGGGAELMLKVHAEGLQSKGHSVTVLVLNANKEIDDYSDQSGVRIIKHPIKNVYWPLAPKPGKFKRLIWHLIDIYNPFYIRFLKKKLSEINPDVVICENIVGWSPAIYKVINNKQITVIQLLHDYGFLCANANMVHNGCRCEKQCNMCKFFTMYHRRSQKYITHDIFVSQSVKDVFERHGMHKSIPFDIVYNARHIDVVKKCDIWDGQRVLRIGYIGTLSEAKGVLNLIQAVKGLHGVAYKLFIAGKAANDSFMQTVENAIADVENIEYVGYVNPKEFFSKIDVAVFPSVWYEPFGLVAVEACSCQVPCIVPNFGGLSEIVKDGVNGIFCNPESVKSIQNSIIKIAKDASLYKELLNNCINSVADFRNENLMLDKMDEICHKVVNK